GITRTRTYPTAAAGVARRKSVVIVGASGSSTDPSAAAVTGPTSCQEPPATRCSSETPVTPRTQPFSVTLLPYAIGEGVGCCSASEETSNQVERRPIAPRSLVPATEASVGM